MKSSWPLLALAIGAFGIGTTEFAPMGLLPTIATGVGVDIPTAGLLVSAYAIGVMLGAPVMTLLFGRLRTRTALITLMAIFTLGNLLSAMAPDYWTLLAARLVTSLNHGAFFGLGSMVAASLVPKEKQAAAIATMFMGLTIANIGGVPAATWIGQQIGWRAAFGGTAVLGVVAMLALLAALPKGAVAAPTNVRSELTVITRTPVLLALLTTVLGAGAMFTLYTYVVPMLETLTAASPTFITLALVLVGVGFTIGNGLGGRLAEWSLDGSIKLFLAAITVTLIALPFLMTTQVGALIGLFAFGIATFGIVPPVQTKVMQAASAAPGLASSVNIGAFNLGNALGAAVGGVVIALDIGLPAVSFAGAAVAALGLLVVFISARRPALVAQPAE
ncbi:MFS transporter, DHA1 family, inner membrane transport protein [Devosia sp. YR412]|uniref:MFS transporter n=1 Tax=Devosia sp. YR412 TaxID=1881030 RepID=UPI0008C180E7|nr:MFS transporter [Devosia sp. YR412]SEQ09186.1 MFS transporter, DHA1 family, inner membrane transport protein [Devosia sp. YR412]